MERRPELLIGERKPGDLAGEGPAESAKEKGFGNVPELTASLLVSIWILGGRCKTFSGRTTESFICVREKPLIWGSAPTTAGPVLGNVSSFSVLG